MADLNAVLQLTAPHKQRVLGALLKQSPEKLKKEADARAFISLTYGPMATDMDSSHIQWLVHMSARKLLFGRCIGNLRREERGRGREGVCWHNRWPLTVTYTRSDSAPFACSWQVVVKSEASCWGEPDGKK